MVIKSGNAILLLRYNNYKKTDFIEEHNKVTAENGYVWLLKTGRKLVEKNLQKVMDESSVLLLKAPKSSGGRLFYARIIEYRYGKQEQEKKSPEYYKELVDDDKLWQIDSLEGTWFKISKIEALDETIMDKLVLISNGKKVSEVIGSTISSSLYICGKEDVTL